MKVLYPIVQNDGILIPMQKSVNLHILQNAKGSILPNILQKKNAILHNLAVHLGKGFVVSNHKCIICILKPTDLPHL